MQKEKSTPDHSPDPDLSSIRSADITFEEQVEIIGEINEVLEKNRIDVKPETFAFTARKKGSLIPLLINGGALLILAASAFFLLAFFNQEERTLIRESATVLSAEGKLIAALRQESQQQLGAKDRQIAEIRARLEDLRKQADAARLDTEAKILERENQLRAELETQLAAERRKLQGEGLSSAAVNDQVRALEQRLDSENESRMREFRNQSQAELDEKEAEIAVLEEQYRQSLLQFQQERSTLQQQFSQREAELRAQLARQAAAAESAQAEVADQLAQLREQQQREQLLLDQIASLRRLVEVQGEASQAEELLAAISATAAEADRLLQSGDSEGAADLYSSAIDRIPDIRRSHAYLVEEARTSALAEGRTQGGSSADANRLQAELDRNRNTLSQTRSSLDQRTRELNQARATISRQNQQLAKYEASEREIAAVRQEVTAIRARYSSLAGGGASARVSQAKVLDLVDTKLQVREVLSSEPVKSRYPELYEAMEEYFDTYGTVQQQAGQEEALKDANAVLEDILGGGSADLAAMKGKFNAADGDPFALFLEKLEALLR